MQTLSLTHPLAAPIYYRETVSSTMDESRRLAAQGSAHGTVIVADFQSAGRGRMGRPWQADRGENLFFTILLRYGAYESIPEALTLKTGLAIARAIEDFAPSLTGEVRVKWPNDIMLGMKKAVGILTEADGQTVYIGIGVNVGQNSFPPAIQAKATSIALAINTSLPNNARFTVLEHILASLFAELARPDNDWHLRLTERLYMNGERVRFRPGGADSGVELWGKLCGIGEAGELLIIPDGEADARSFITGELDVYVKSV